MFCYQITRTDMVVLYWNWHLSAFLELFWKNKKDVWGVFRPKPSKNFLRQMSQMRSCLPVWNIMDCPNAVLPLSIPFLSPCQQHHMQTICSSLQSDNLTNTLLLNFTGWMLFLTCQPTVSKHWRLYANVAEFVAEWHSVGNCKASGSGETEATTSKEKSKFSWTDDANNNTWYSRSEIPE